MEAWVEAAAARFWEAAAGTEPFPRGLDGSVSLALPVTVTRLPGLSTSVVRRWLLRHVPRLDSWEWGERRERGLHACLAAFDGRGFILLDSEDPPDEQRYSLAHEAAHFMLDYQRPREQVARRLGPVRLAVLDGRRSPTEEERLDAALAGLKLEAHVHLMERGPRGIEQAAVAESEQNADRLALELLAPWREATAVLPDTDGTAERVRHGAQALATTFGLPEAAARSYAQELIDARDGPPSWRAWLR